MPHCWPVKTEKGRQKQVSLLCLPASLESAFGFYYVKNQGC